MLEWLWIWKISYLLQLSHFLLVYSTGQDIVTLTEPFWSIKCRQQILNSVMVYDLFMFTTVIIVWRSTCIKWHLSFYKSLVWICRKISKISSLSFWSFGLRRWTRGRTRTYRIDIEIHIVLIVLFLKIKRVLLKPVTPCRGHFLHKKRLLQPYKAMLMRPMRLKYNNNQLLASLNIKYNSLK